MNKASNMNIGAFSKLTGLTARAIRLYETKGIFPRSSRSESDYRQYGLQDLERAKQVKELRDMGFSLTEVSSILKMDPKASKDSLFKLLASKLEQLGQDATELKERKEKLKKMMSLFIQSKNFTDEQRRYIVNEMYERTLTELRGRGIAIGKSLESQLVNETKLAAENDFSEVLQISGKIAEIAEEENFLIGPGRGTSAGSLILFSKGLNKNPPQKFGLIPELFYRPGRPNMWIDVEVYQAKNLVSKIQNFYSVEQLKKNGIFIFQCPFLEIIKNIQERIGKIDFDSHADDSDEVLSSFHDGDLENIFLFHSPKRSVMNANSTLDFLIEERRILSELKTRLRDYKVKSAEDVINLNTLYFPLGDREKQLKAYLADEINSAVPTRYRDMLQSTKGLLLYREDWIRILCKETGCSVFEADRLYNYKRGLREPDQEMISIFEKLDLEIRKFLNENVKTVFLKSHMVSMWWFIKRSCVLNALYRSEFESEIQAWSKQHNSAWSDLGFIDRDYRPLSVYW